MPKAVIKTDERLTHQIYWGREFGAGLKRHGWEVQILDRNAWPQIPKCDLLVLWGIRNQDAIKIQKGRGDEVCILERGYIGDRFAWTSVSFGGGLNGRGHFRGPLADPSRWQKHFSHLLQEWNNKPDGYALIMGQVQGDTAVRNVDLNSFYAKASNAFASQGIQTRLRQHPHGRSNATPIGADLDGARCAVTWNSNSGVVSILMGVPAIAMDAGSMAWDVAGHELKQPPMPDRTAWAHAMAWKQWSLDEMKSGYCWEMIGHDIG